MKRREKKGRRREEREGKGREGKEIHIHLFGLQQGKGRKNNITRAPQ